MLCIYQFSTAPFGTGISDLSTGKSLVHQSASLSQPHNASDRLFNTAPTKYTVTLGVYATASILVRYNSGCKPHFPHSGAKESLRRETCDEQELVHPTLNRGDKRLKAPEQVHQ